MLVIFLDFYDGPEDILVPILHDLRSCLVQVVRVATAGFL